MPHMGPTVAGRANLVALESLGRLWGSLRRARRVKRARGLKSRLQGPCRAAWREVHFGRLTWSLKKACIWTTVLLNGALVGFCVSFPECTLQQYAKVKPCSPTIKEE